VSGQHYTGPAHQLAQQLCEAGRALLASVLLQEAHVGGLVELCARGALPLLHPGIAEVQGKGTAGARGQAEGGKGEAGPPIEPAEEGEGAPKTDRKKGAGKGSGGVEEGLGKGSYHALVFQVRTWLALCCPKP